MRQEKHLKDLTIAVKGAGDLASGLAWRLHQACFKRICMLEVEKPLAVRRGVAFSEAINDGEKTVEGLTAVRINELSELEKVWSAGQIGVLADPEWTSIKEMRPDVVIDAILAKKNLGTRLEDAPLVIGLGPGFKAGRDVHRVIETRRGHNLGRVLKTGQAEKNTGIPGNIEGYTTERVLRAPVSGVFEARKRLGDLVKQGDVIAVVGGEKVTAKISGVLRGLIRNGVDVSVGMKTGDIDPRGIVDYCNTISDKARSIGGAVLEAILERFNR